jgi:hypothetical protein
VKNLNDLRVLQVTVQSGLRILTQEVHPESPLQGYRAALQLLAVRSGTLLDAESRELPALTQLFGFDVLLRLPVQPPEAFWSSLLPRFEALLRQNPSLPGQTRAIALVHAAARANDAADLAGRWVVEAPLEAEPYFCRLLADLRSDERAFEVDAAMHDGMCAVQYAADHDEMLRAVVARIEAVAASAQRLKRDRLTAMAAAFRDANPEVR